MPWNKIGTEQRDCVEWGRNWRLSCKDHVFPHTQDVKFLKIGMWKLLSGVSLEKGPGATSEGLEGTREERTLNAKRISTNDAQPK